MAQEIIIEVVVPEATVDPVVIEVQEDYAPVQAVNGKIGWVTLDKTDIGLPNVENISIIATSGVLQAQIDNLDTGYATDAQLAATGQSLVNSINNLSGTLDVSGSLLYVQDLAISGDLNSALNLTGQNLLVRIDDLSGSLNQTGNNLSQKIDTASGYLQNQIDNLDVSSYATDAELSGASGYLADAIYQTGNTLNQTINNLSGALNSSGQTLSQNLNSTGSNLQQQINDINNSGFLTGVDLSNYYTNDNPSGFITGVSLAGYVQKSETGSFITAGETGAFYSSANPAGFITGVDLSSYYPRSNPSGYISGIDLSSYYTKDNPSGFITGVDLSIYATGVVVRPSDTGIFYTNDNPSGFITGVSLVGYVQKSETGTFITTAQTGAFYPRTNPSGYITGVVLTGYVQKSETGNFITTSQTGAFYPRTNPSGFITGVNLSAYATKSGANFTTRPTVTGVPILLSGEAAQLPETIVYTTGDQVISGNKDFYADEYLFSGAQVIFDADSALVVSGLASFVGSRPTVFGTGVLLSGEAVLTDLSMTVMRTGDQIVSGDKTFVDTINFDSVGTAEFSGANLYFIDSTGIVSGSGSAWQFENRPTVNGTVVMVSGDVDLSNYISTYLKMVSGNYAVSTSDSTVQVVSGGIIVTLPSTTGLLTNKQYNIKNSANSSVTLSGYQTIESASTQQIYPNECLTVFSAPSGSWFVI